jgi:hypothetical protein
VAAIVGEQSKLQPNLISFPPARHAAVMIPDSMWGTFQPSSRCSERCSHIQGQSLREAAASLQAMVGLEEHGRQWETRMHCGDVRISSLPSGASLRDVQMKVECCEMCWLTAMVALACASSCGVTASINEVGDVYGVWYFLLVASPKQLAH